MMVNPFTALYHQLQTGDVILALALVFFVSWGACRVGFLYLREETPARLHQYAHLAWQVGALLGLEQAYEMTRGHIPHRAEIALPNAYRLFDFELRHGIFVESRIERYFLKFHFAMSAIDLFYVFGHVVITLGMLVWVCTRRRDVYPFARNMLMLTTAVALLAFYIYPTAPPRLFPNLGFVDPAQLYHFVSEGGAQPDSYTYNPYAAMPSLHVAYAMVVGWTLMLSVRSTAIRLLATFYPIVMSAVVIISGNHWLLDVLGAVATVLGVRLSLLVVSYFCTLRRATNHRRTVVVRRLGPSTVE